MSNDPHLKTIQKLVGVALIFMGFIGMLLSISGNYPLDPYTAITYLLGVIMFVHAGGQSWRRWIIIALAAVLAALFGIRGEVSGTIQLALFWGTVVVILAYTFLIKEQKNPHEDATGKGSGTGD